MPCRHGDGIQEALGTLANVLNELNGDSFIKAPRISPRPDGRDLARSTVHVDEQNEGGGIKWGGGNMGNVGSYQKECGSVQMASEAAGSGLCREVHLQERESTPLQI